MLLRLLAISAFAGVSLASASSITWVDWTGGTAGVNGSASGVLHIGGTDVAVTYSGEIAFLQTSGGTYFWTEPNPSLRPYTSSVVDNAPPDSDIIALSSASTKTLTFAQPIDNLFFAVVSLNGNGYRFSQDFDLISDGCGFWGCGGLTKVTGSGTFDLNSTGGEPHGVIRFQGAVSSITWDSLTAENWNGFTIGTLGLATPEPGSAALLLLGFAGMLPLLRSRK